MRGNSFIRLMLPVVALVSACGLTRPGSATPQALPSPAGTWTVELKQSGGFAGVQMDLQITSAGQLTATDERSGRTVTQALGADTIVELRRLIAQIGVSDAGGSPSACADCFIYDLTLKSDSGTIQMRADDVTLADSKAQALISYLRTLRDAALASQP